MPCLRAYVDITVEKLKCSFIYQNSTNPSGSGIFYNHIPFPFRLLQLPLEISHMKHKVHRRNFKDFPLKGLTLLLTIGNKLNLLTVLFLGRGDRQIRQEGFHEEEHFERYYDRLWEQRKGQDRIACQSGLAKTGLLSPERGCMVS